MNVCILTKINVTVHLHVNMHARIPCYIFKYHIYKFHYFRYHRIRL